MDVELRRPTKTSTLRQLELMVEFLQKHPFLVQGNTRSKEAQYKAQSLWAECARQLNAEGPRRTAKEWAKVSIRMKCRTLNKARVSGINSLTPLETKLLITSRPNHKSLDKSSTSESEKKSSQDPEPDPLSRTSVATVKNEPMYEVHVEELEILDEETLQEPHSVSSSPTQDPQEQEPQQPSKQSDNDFLLKEIHSKLLNIEQTRVQAELKNAKALCSVAESFRLIAESIDRFSRKYCED